MKRSTVGGSISYLWIMDLLSHRPSDLSSVQMFHAEEKLGKIALILAQLKLWDMLHYFFHLELTNYLTHQLTSKSTTYTNQLNHLVPTLVNFHHQIQELAYSCLEDRELPPSPVN